MQGSHGLWQEHLSKAEKLFADLGVQITSAGRCRRGDWLSRFCARVFGRIG